MNKEKSEKYLSAPDYPRSPESHAENHAPGRWETCLPIRKEGPKKASWYATWFMPDMTADSRRILDFIAEEIGPKTCVNVMPQYYPAHRAREFPELDRHLFMEEYLSVCAHADKIGLCRIR